MDLPKVLVVDDDPVMADLLKQSLEGNDCEVLTASDGIEALEKVRADNPAVVLLDIRMPRKSGLETLQEIKQYNKDIAVIMITGVDDEEIGRRALGMGAFDYIVKPFELSHLEKVIQWQLHLLA